MAILRVAMEVAGGVLVMLVMSSVALSLLSSILIFLWQPSKAAVPSAILQ